MLEKDEIIKINNEEYFIMIVLNDNDKYYGLGNKIDENDNSLNEYRIIYKENDEYNILTDEVKCNRLLPIFEKLFNNELKNIGKVEEDE